MSPRAHALPVLLALLAATPIAAAGTWTKLVHLAPQKVNGLVLLGDGTVMAARNNGSTIGKGWYRLTPDATGSYVNGTWVALASMHDSRLYYATQVLKDGRVFVAGGEYGTGGPHAEVYDPQTNVWTQIDPPATLWNTATDNFVDSMAEILDDGRVLIMPVSPHSFGVPLIYDPASDTWVNGGKLKHNIQNQVEATWVKLPDHSILTIDPFSTKAQRYFEDTDTWLNDGPEPVMVYDPFIGEMGGALLLPTGDAIFFGASGHNVLYTPSGSIALGTWTPAPDFPDGQGTPDAPCAMLVTGNVLCDVSKTPSAGSLFPSPTSFYEYDPISNAFTQVSGPTGLTDATSTFPTAMLALPDGKVLYSHMNNDLYVYDPGGAPVAAGKPVISAVTQNPGGNWHLDGLQLNGISEGASYGDDLQMNSNYPMVRLTSGSSVYYLRSHDWSSTGVMTGSTPVSTEFDVPPSVPQGSYALEVVANGIASDPVPFTVQGFGTWASAGAGLAGVLGVPSLTGSGTQVAPDLATLTLTNANPLAPATLFVGLSSTPTPFKGGTLYRCPSSPCCPSPRTSAAAWSSPSRGRRACPRPPPSSGSTASRTRRRSRACR
ncbi:MAG TPA: kelch repeat-containing protein [Planctomycetota bacterium]|nr:kelch repeat-containing protein [Planctomycetota bacterium]